MQPAADLFQQLFCLDVRRESRCKLGVFRCGWPAAEANADSRALEEAKDTTWRFIVRGGIHGDRLASAQSLALSQSELLGVKMPVVPFANSTIIIGVL